MPTLAIIDMQENFPASRNKTTVQAVCREIGYARKRKDGILIVEYRVQKGKRLFNSDGRTHPDILKALGKYKRWYYVYKCDNDGSDEIAFACQKYRFDHSHFKICGVNLGACVLSTVKGLSNIYGEIGTIIEVIKDACNSTRPWEEFVIWRKFSHLTGVKLKNEDNHT